MLSEKLVLVAVEPNTKRVRAVWAVTAVAMVVVALAASSDPVDVWTTTSTTVELVDRSDVAGTRDLPEPERSEPGDAGFDGGPLGALVEAAVVLLLIAIVIVGASWLRPSVKAARFGWLRRTSRDFDAEPHAAPARLKVDVDAAQARLVGGTPRNSIVGCWMQLERDATSAGFPRAESDTSTEYVERVVGMSSIDPAPIAQLAGLYREARFSRHELSDSHRADAVLALTNVVDALQHPVTT